MAWTEEEVGLIMKELSRPNHAEVIPSGIAIQIKNAGIRGSPYSLRHTACTRLCRLAKGDLAVVQSIIGHRTPFPGW